MVALLQIYYLVGKFVARATGLIDSVSHHRLFIGKVRDWASRYSALVGLGAYDHAAVLLKHVFHFFGSYLDFNQFSIWSNYGGMD